MLVLFILACQGPSVPIVEGLVFAALPACELLPVGESLDIKDGCAVGVCANTSYASFVDVLGEPADCDPSDSTKCEWDEGVAGYFDRLDGEVDPESVASALYVTESFTGSDENGLGIGVSLGCFIEVLGQPEAVEAVLVAGEYYVEELSFPDLTVHSATFDGRSARLTVYNE